MSSSLEIIHEKSKEILNRQISSYRSLHQKAGIVIAATALFSPISIYLIDKTDNQYLKLLTAISVLVSVVGIIYLMSILRSQPIKQGYDESLFEELINEKPKKVLNHEIAYNKYSIENNVATLDRQNKRYNSGILLIVISIIFTILLLIVNSFMS